MFVYVYYETDGDSGWYGIQIFKTLWAAKAHAQKSKSGYGNITKMEVREV